MKKKINLFESLQSDDLTPDLQMLENLCGIETVRKLIENYSGMYFYIPKVTSLKSFIYISNCDLFL